MTKVKSSSSPHRRILISAYEYHPKGVSEAWTAYQVVAALRRRGHQVLVMTRASPNKPAWHGVARVRCILPKRSLMWAPNYAEYLVRIAGVAKRFEGKFDVVQHASPITLRAPNSLGLANAPFVWGPVGGCISFPPGFGRYLGESGMLNSLRKLDGWRLRHDPTLQFTMRTASSIVVTSSMAGMMIPEEYQSKVSVIPAGVAEGTLLPAPAGEEPYIFSSGRLLPYKALDLLIRAFARLRGAESVRLIITGEGPLRAQLEKLSADLGVATRVELRGLVAKQENHRLMSRSLFCVYPSLKEAFGHVNLEAMAAWKPVVVTDWAGPRDLIVDGVTGFKVLGANADEHVEMLLIAMQRLLDDSGLRARMGAAGAARVQSDYQWDPLAAKYDAVYSRIT